MTGIREITQGSIRHILELDAEKRKELAVIRQQLIDGATVEEGPYFAELEPRAPLDLDWPEYTQSADVPQTLAEPCGVFVGLYPPSDREEEEAEEEEVSDESAAEPQFEEWPLEKKLETLQEVRATFDRAIRKTRYQIAAQARAAVQC